MQLPLEAGGPEVVVSVSSEDTDPSDPSDPSDLSCSLASDLSPPATTSRQDRQAAWLRSVQQSRTSEMEFDDIIGGFPYVTQSFQLKQR